MAVTPTINTITATNDEATSPLIHVAAFSNGSFLVPGSITAVAFFAAATTSTTPVAIYTQGNAALSLSTTAATWVSFPREVFNHAYICVKLTGASSASFKYWLGTSETGPDSAVTVAVTSDSELPAAAALADNTANPTVPGVGAFLMGFDGTTWDRVPVTSAAGLKVQPATGGSGAADATTSRTIAATDSPEVTALQIIDDWDSTDACKSVAIQVQKTAACDSANLLAAAGDYAANDVLSNDATNGAGDPWIFSNAGRIASGTGVILGADIKTSVEAFAVRVRVHLFNAAPTTSEMDDNAAFGVDLDDRAKYLGYFDFPAMTDAGEFSFAQADGINKSFNTDASGHLYAILQTLDAATNESAGMSLWVTIRVSQD